MKKLQGEAKITEGNEGLFHPFMGKLQLKNVYLFFISIHHNLSFIVNSFLSNLCQQKKNLS